MVKFDYGEQGLIVTGHSRSKELKKKIKKFQNANVDFPMVATSLFFGNMHDLWTREYNSVKQTPEIGMVVRYGDK